ncbi:hypothetical protein [Streptomyces sp. NRRL B-24720]|uniref:hypothetical protein n=1 Tax=Streptomyces sp. NRRL B-24720 TaxID=1476876 RepID=UPI00131CB8AF|nr:hypothetical protein [Streptomyces sp. NRRL B-24720]
MTVCHPQVPATLRPAARLKRRGDRQTSAALDDAELSDEVADRVLRSFLSGVFLDGRSETSARLLHLVWRSMIQVTLCPSAEDIGAAPAHLAAALPERLESDTELLRTAPDAAPRGERRAR